MIRRGVVASNPSNSCEVPFSDVFSDMPGLASASDSSNASSQSSDSEDNGDMPTLRESLDSPATKNKVVIT